MNYTAYRRIVSLATMAAAILTIASCALAQAPANAGGQVGYNGPKKRIAVMNMTAEAAANGQQSEWARIVKDAQGTHTVSDVGQRITEMLTTALVQSNRFIVVERAGIDDTRSEIAVGQELGNEQTRVNKGNVIGAQVLVRAAVTEFVDNGSKQSGGISLGGVRLGGGKKESKVVVDVRMYDAATSVVLCSEKAEGKSTEKGGAIALSLGSLGLAGAKSNNDPIELATRNALEKAVLIIIDKMESVPWEGKVADVEENGNKSTLTINRGSKDGLKAGDTLKIYKAGKEYTDPDTGIKKNKRPTYVCDAKVSYLDADSCEVTVDKDAGVAVKDLVRFD